MSIFECRVIHQGYPAGTTCLDKKKYARDFPGRYSEGYRDAILNNEHLCDNCRHHLQFEDDEVQALFQDVIYAWAGERGIGLDSMQVSELAADLHEAILDPI